MTTPKQKLWNLVLDRWRRGLIVRCPLRGCRDGVVQTIHTRYTCERCNGTGLIVRRYALLDRPEEQERQERIRREREYQDRRQAS